MSMTYDRLEKTYKLKVIEITQKDKIIDLPYGEDSRIQDEVKEFEEVHRINELIKANDDINHQIHILLEHQKQLVDNVAASVKYFSEEINEWELDK